MRRLAIIVSTYNRASSLEHTLGSLDAAVASRLGAVVKPNPSDLVDVIVVDNNSTDGTPDVAASFGPGVRYIQERRQGLSYARNTGIEAARALDAEIVAFIDDDVVATAGWVNALQQTFEDYPKAECVGGRVLPANPEALPDWLTQEHWGPLALQDHGPVPLIFDASLPRGLVGANFAFRRRVFDWLGGFSTDVQRVRDGIGSTEDHEMLQRLYDAGGCALYDPGIVALRQVPAERMTHEYHRRWHLGHGRFTARMPIPQTERTTSGRRLGVPGHLVRGAATDAVRWLRLSAANDRAHAFEAETRLWFFSGFFKERCACALRR